MKSIIDGDGKLAFQPLGGLVALPSEDKTGAIYNINFDGGLRLDKNPREIPINSCVDMNQVRFQNGALAVGFDKSALSTAASSRVVGISTHGRLVGGASVIATVRFLISGGNLILERWNGSTWTTEVTQSIATTAIAIRVAMLSLQDTLIVAPADVGFTTPAAFYWKESTNQLLAIDATADIAPRYLAKFGDRLIFFQDIASGGGGQVELQSLAWSVDGSILDFTGTGSGQIFLIDTPSHEVDALQGGVQIGNNILAIFRQRSIMRAFETGNTAQSIGATHWIEGIGTESPFSITPVPVGVCFLGHNGLAYFLTEQGPTPIGEAIQSEVMSRLTVANRREGVQAGYDAINQHWWLCVPANGASNNMTTAFIFDMGRFITTREKIWMKLDLTTFSGSAVQSMGSTIEAL